MTWWLPDEVWQKILFYCGINLLLVPISKQWYSIANRNSGALISDWITRESEKDYSDDDLVVRNNIPRIYNGHIWSWLNYRTWMRFKHVHDILNHQPLGNSFIFIIGRSSQRFYIVSPKNIRYDLRRKKCCDILTFLNGRPVEIDQETNYTRFNFRISFELLIPKELTIEETVYYLNMYKHLEITLKSIYRKWSEILQNRRRLISEQYK